MLDWLLAEPVLPALGDASGEYAEFLTDLTHAQALIAGAHGSGSPLVADFRREAIDSLEALLASAHCVSLPSQTAEAVRWHLHQLSR